MNLKTVQDIIRYINSRTQTEIFKYSYGRGSNSFFGTLHRTWREVLPGLGGTPSVVKAGQAAYAGAGPNGAYSDHVHYFTGIRIYEVDGSPDLYVHTLMVSNATLYDLSNGHARLYNSGEGTPAIPSGANPTATVGASAVNGSAATFLRSDGAPALASSFKDAGISLLVDGGGVAITNTTKYFFAFPWAGTLTGWDLIADQSGNITVDVQEAAYGSFPGSAASIFGTVPALASAQRAQARSLSIAITKENWAQVVVTGAATIIRCTLALYITRS